MESSADLPLRSPFRILVVEDEFLIALALEDMLSAAGYGVVGVARTFEEALRLSLESKPDLVLMDIQIASRRDGVDAAIQLREAFNIPSLFTTANVDPDTVGRAKAADPVGWLSKPYAPDALINAVDGALGLR